MATLVLKGHPTRGIEVIQLLVMLGAKSQYTGTFKGFYYWIEDELLTSSDIPPENSMIFSLEEFLEKYPYKVGDKVKAWVNGYCGVFNIQDITWDSIAKEVKYRIHDYWHSVENLQPYKEETMEEKGDKAKAPDLKGEDYSDKRFGYKIPDGYEFDTVYNGNIILKPKKAKYPTTYKECCEVLCIGTMDNDAQGYKADLIIRFQELIIARNAYWKIAGKEMGLDKPWAPDWKDSSQQKYTIFYYQDEASLSKGPNVNRFLSFPTEEIRDIFYENFKNLIENCKELL